MVVMPPGMMMRPSRTMAASSTYTLTINGITVNGFANGQNTGSKLWANKNSMDAAHLSVTIDGNKVH